MQQAVDYLLRQQVQKLIAVENVHSLLHLADRRRKDQESLVRDYSG